MLTSDHVRRVVSLPPKLNRLLEWAVIRYRIPKAKIVVFALCKYFNRLDLDAEAHTYAQQLDDILGRLAPIEHAKRAEFESLKLLAEYLLEVYWYLFEGKVEQRPGARERLAEFKKRVHRQVASGRITIFNEEWASVLNLSDPRMLDDPE